MAELNNDFRYKPEDYGGDTRVHSGDGFVAFTDSGGSVKYNGVNHDRIIHGSSDFAAPHTMHKEMVGKAAAAADAITEEAGSTMSIATWKNGKIYTTHVGDSPVWVMERKSSGDVIPHLINANFHNPSPYETNIIGENLGNGKGTEAIEELKTEPARFQNFKDFLGSRHTGSQFFMLGGSDGLLDHTGVAPPNGMGAQHASMAFTYNKEFRDAHMADQQAVDQQVAEAGKRYAKIFEEHVNEGGSLNDPRLAAKINDAATAMHAEKKGALFLKTPTHKDNTSFVIAELHPDKEITTIIADGNYSSGHRAAQAVVDAAAPHFTLIKTPGLEVAHSAESAYVALPKKSIPDPRPTISDIPINEPKPSTLSPAAIEQAELGFVERLQKYHATGKGKAVIYGGAAVVVGAAAVTGWVHKRNQEKAAQAQAAQQDAPAAHTR